MANIRRKKKKEDEDLSKLPGRVKKVESVNNFIILILILLCYKQCFPSNHEGLYVTRRDTLYDGRSISDGKHIPEDTDQQSGVYLRAQNEGLHVAKVSDLKGDLDEPQYKFIHNSNILVDPSVENLTVDRSVSLKSRREGLNSHELLLDAEILNNEKEDDDCELTKSGPACFKKSIKTARKKNLEKKLKNGKGKISLINETNVQEVSQNKEENLFHKRVLSKSLGSRKLEIKETNTTCNGTLFDLELRLGENAGQKSWELRDDITNTIVAFQNFRFRDSLEKHTFSMCLVPGPYTFAIMDESKRGFSCDVNGPRCYEIYLNNELLMKGHSFVGRNIVHTFDSSSFCFIDNTALLQFDKNTSDVIWSMHNVESDESVTFEPLLNESNRSNTKETYIACMPAGSYSYEIFTQTGEELSCNHTNQTDECFSMTINEQAIISKTENLSRMSGFFFISKDGDANEQICPSSPILAPLNAFNGHVFDESISRKLDLIYSLSSFDDVHNPSTSQYRAACLMVYDDSRENISLNNDWIERYVLSVFLYAMNELAETLPKHICDYDKARVECDNTGQVTSIDFSALNIQGTIPPELSFFKELERLDLNHNNLEGTIPSTLGELLQLKELRLDRNKLGGSIFSEIGNMMSLEQLLLSSNSIAGSIPFQLGLCTHLQRVIVDANKLEGPIPHSLYDLTSLSELTLSNNNLEGGISTGIKRLQNLQFARLENNALTGLIPADVGDLPLEQLILSNNVFTGTFPVQIGNIKSLQLLLISNNRLSGIISDSFENSHELTTIDLSSNFFSGSIPNSIWELENLKEINLKGNNFVGEVAIDDCSKYDVLGIDNSMWLDDEPTVECTCCVIEECNVWEVTGKSTQTPCPESNIHEFTFYNLYRIEDIHARSFQSRGDFARFDEANVCLSPTGCYQLSYRDETRTAVEYNMAYSSDTKSLEENGECNDVSICNDIFTISDPRRIMLNHLTQTVEFHIGDRDNPRYESLCWILTEDLLNEEFNICDGTLLQRYVIVLFYLSSGFGIDLSGLSAKDTCAWPGIMCDATGKFVEVIDFEGFSLSGSIIKEIGYLTNLKVLNLSNNDLDGTLDPWIIKHLPNLEEFRIEKNAMKGEIPKELFALPEFREIYASSNSFTGSLPDYYSQNLEFIDVSDNILKGTLSSNMFTPPRLKYIDISENGLRGSIPSEIGMLDNLEVLKFSRNRLTGSIPPEIFNSRLMELFMVQGNVLTGSLPTTIGNIRKATKVLINHNLLKGSIPSELSNLSNVTLLHLHSNKFVGTAPIINSTDFNFVADCKAVVKLDCASCTMCCDDQEDCTPHDSEAEYLYIDSLIYFLLVPFGTLLLMFNWHHIRRCCNWNCFKARDPCSIYSDDSVYSFIFSSSPMAWCIHIITLGIQNSLYFTFLWASDPQNPKSLVSASEKCLWDSDECVIIREPIQEVGWLLFFVMTLLYLTPDIVDSFLQLRMCFQAPFDARFMINGLFLMALTIVSVTASYSFNFATAATNTDLIINAVILLFINDLDEQTMSCLEKLVPEWTETRVEEVHMYMKNRKIHIEERAPYGKDNSDGKRDGVFDLSPIKEQSEHGSNYLSAQSEQTDVHSPSSLSESFDGFDASVSFSEATLEFSRSPKSSDGSAW